MLDTGCEVAPRPTRLDALGPLTRMGSGSGAIRALFYITLPDGVRLVMDSRLAHVLKNQLREMLAQFWYNSPTRQKNLNFNFIQG